METRWSLKELYPSFESKEFKGDLEKCDKLIETINQWVNSNISSTENAASKMEEYVKLENEFTDLILKLYSFAGLSSSVNCKDDAALRYSELIEQKITMVTEAQVKETMWISRLENLEEIINSSELLKEHKYHILELAEKSKHMLSEKEEVVLAKMKTTASSAWTKLQELLTSTLVVDVELNGEVQHTTLPIARNMAYEKDPAVRKAAFEGEIKSYEKINESIAAALNGIKGEAITVSKLRGYNSILEQTLDNSRMDKETLDVMLSVMKEYFPAFRKYFKKKASLLGHKGSLPFYDLFAPMGEANMRYTYDEARQFIVANFRTFSDKLADFADNAFEKQWIDADPRSGKVGGAFCAGIHAIKESRVLCNFSGSFGDVATIAHELGHGYHGHCLNDEYAVNSDYPMPIAETASTFCETIIKNAALKTATKEEAFTILESDIQDDAQIIIDIYCRYLFETEVIRRREEGSLSVKDLNDIMIWAQKETYGDGLDENYLHPYMWACKSHYYSADLNFYNFPYAFGLLFAKGLYAEYLKRGDEFVRDYDKLLAATGKNKIADVTMMMGIDIHSEDFWRGSLNTIEKNINKFLAL